MWPSIEHSFDTQYQWTRSWIPLAKLYFQASIEHPNAVTILLSIICIDFVFVVIAGDFNIHMTWQQH